MTLADKIYNYHIKKWILPTLSNEVTWLNPYQNEEVKRIYRAFHDKYYNDNRPRIYLLGINPGRLGAGITGIPFTDPIRLVERIGIEHDFAMKREISSVFIYDVIEAYGGEEVFYGDFAISSVCPLGFVKGGKNYNYYDDKTLIKEVNPFIHDHLNGLTSIGALSGALVSLGMGKNFKHLKAYNKALDLSEMVYKLPHPRWVMQYRLNKKNQYIEEYVVLFRRLCNLLL